MATTTQQRQRGQRGNESVWTPGWVALIAVLAAVATALAARAHVLPVAVWGLPLLAVAGAAVTGLVVLAQDGALRTHVHHAGAWLATGTWTTWIAAAGWTVTNVLALIVGAAVLTALAPLCRTHPVVTTHGGGLVMPPEEPNVDRRPEAVRRWEALIRTITKKAVTVTDVEPWDNARDGCRVFFDLVDQDGRPLDMSWRDIDLEACVKMQAACKLPPGCVIRVLEGEHQGSGVLDVMLRDCLVDEVLVEEDYSPASINDSFNVMTSPRGERLDVCLREQSMVVGGTTGSGKTTLLHRIILFLARCIDALIWVIDLNGGGVAEPWISPWARGLAKRPVIDWVAGDEAEAAVMVTVATAIAKDRKTNREAIRRKREANADVLPVDRSLPAIVILTDEGGEVRQAASLLGKLVTEKLSRLVQIGRAEAVRAVMSILRGTADLLDKGFRVNAAIRLCLRMEEEDEYTHVLGTYPGSTRLIHKGTGYLRRAIDFRPIFGRTVKVARDVIERAAIACSDLRPDLDDGGLRVAADLAPEDVLDGRDASEWMSLPVMRDVAAGRAYTGRWDRYASKLAEMRGEEPPLRPKPAPRVTAPAGPPAGSARHALLHAAGIAPAAPPRPPAEAVPVDEVEPVDKAPTVTVPPAPAIVEPAAPVLPSRPTPTRQHIFEILDAVYPRALTSSQIGAQLNARRAAVNRTYRQDVLKSMKGSGEIAQVAGGGYTVVRDREVTRS